MSLDLRVPGPGEQWLTWFFTTDIEKRSAIDYTHSGNRGYLSKTCPKCTGSGLDAENLLSDRKLECLTCYGTGSVVDGVTPADTGDMYRACPSCNGVEGANMDCELCDASGLVDNLTAQITSEYHESPSVEMDEEQIARYAMIAKRVGLLSEESTLVLSAFYGFPGLRWGQQFAVMPYTDEGGRLLKMVKNELTKRGSSEMVDVIDAMGNEVSQRRPDRSAMIGLAEQQAEALYLKACQEWRGLGD